MSPSQVGARLIFIILLINALASTSVSGWISRVRRQTNIASEKPRQYIQDDTWTRALVDPKSQDSKAPTFQSFTNDQPLTKPEDLDRLSNLANSVLERLGLAAGEGSSVRRKPLPSTLYQTDDLDEIVNEASQNRIDLQGLTSGQIPGLAPIPVPGFPGPQDIPSIPGVNTIPGLSNFNYVVGQLVPQMIPPTNTLLGASISRLLPKEATKNLAKNVFRAVHPAAENVEVSRMMGRWFQVINSPHVIREACAVSHFGALTNNTYSATFTALKFYREGNPNGPPRYSLSYGFKSGDTGQFLLHNSNSPDAEPFWIIKLGPLNEYNQYDYAVVSNWVRYPVFVIARDPERFTKLHMKSVLQFLEDNNYINVITKAFNMISPVDYSQCQYTPTFSGAGK
uniref:Lipocalin domain-containing protein n=1 Tax=Acrobeloides nanus TaxID=290746 RepID=A0A914C622_9BILA